MQIGKNLLNICKAVSRFKLWAKILIALLLGAVTGYLLGERASFFKPIGAMFLNLVNMIIVPLILSSMTVGITNIHDPAKLGRVGLRTLVVYLGTTAIAIVIGLAFAKTFQPGAGLGLSLTKQVSVTSTMNLTQMVLSMVPVNPVRALFEGNVLQIIVFSIFLGLAINFGGEKGKPLLRFFDSLADVMYRLTSIVMEFSPIGVFAIVAGVVGTFGIQVFGPLLKFLGIFLLACGVHLFGVLTTIIWYYARLSPLPFYKGMGDAMMMAFSTSSSSATLPVTMHCVQENLGVSANISRFVLPLGSTVNMNGTALFQGMSAVFIAQAYGIELGLQELVMVVVTATLSAIGAAGIPGTGFIMLSMVFGAAGIPLEGLGILAGIDRFREMFSTTLNVIGDAVCAVYVAKEEGELDEGAYYHHELVEYEEQA